VVFAQARLMFLFSNEKETGHMNEKRPWHQPRIQLLDARATAANKKSTDADAFHVDPNNNGDVNTWEDTGGPFGLGNETHTAQAGRVHPKFDPGS